MPITYLDGLEGIRMEGKRKLVGRIYAALHEAYPYPDDVRIFLREWRPDSVRQDGQLASEPARPVLMMHIPEGANIDAKRKIEEIRTIAEGESLANYPFYHAALGEFEFRSGKHETAREHFRAALALARNSMERRFFDQRVTACERDDMRHGSERRSASGVARERKSGKAYR